MVKRSQSRKRIDTKLKASKSWAAGRAEGETTDDATPLARVSRPVIQGRRWDSCTLWIGSGSPLAGNLIICQSNNLGDPTGFLFYFFMLAPWMANLAAPHARRRV